MRTTRKSFGPTSTPTRTWSAGARRGVAAWFVAALVLLTTGVVATSAAPAAAACDRLWIPDLGVERCVVPGDQTQIDQGNAVLVTALSSDATHWIAGHHTSHGATFLALTDIEMGDLVEYRGATYSIVDYDLVDRRNPGHVLEWAASPTPSLVLQTSYNSYMVHVWRALPVAPTARVTPVDEPGPTTSAVGPAVGVAVITPARIFDSRYDVGGRLRTSEWRRITVPASSGVPADATAVFANVTVIGRSGAGYVTATSCAGLRHDTSSVNWADGAVVANHVVVPVADRTLCVYAAHDADVVIDVTGYAAPGAAYGLEAIPPRRLLDSRTGAAVRAGEDRRVEVGRSLVEQGAVAASITVTAVAAANGFVTVHPCGADAISTSSVNIRIGTPVANSTLVPTDADGGFCVTPSTDAQVVVDLAGVLVPGGARLQLVDQVRLVDTRVATSSDLNRGFGGRRPVDGADLRLPSQAWRGVPVNSAVAVNVTTVGALEPGFATAWPCDAPMPTASLQNPRPGAAVATAAFVEGGTEGLCVHLHRSSHLIVDLVAVWV